GAATGIGGIVRDILTLGARPIALLDLLYLGEPSDPHASWIARGVVKGISDYGNRIGVPTVAGDTWFDRSFNRQPLVNVACVGLARVEELVAERPRPGDLIVIVGNPTGRDGLLGSSFASKPLGEDVDRDIGAVQVADPLTEKLLIDSLAELVGRRLARYIKDLGGGGLTTAVSEVAAEFNLGAELDLGRLHLRAELTPLEILVSESQERMMVVVEPGRLREVEEVLEKYDLQYSVVGVFTDSGRIVARFRGCVVADVPSRELARPRSTRRESKPPAEALVGLTPVVDLPEVSLPDAILRVLSSPNVSSKRWIYEQYDHEVGARTVVKPGYADAAVLKLDAGDRRGIAVKGDANPRYTYLDPFNGAANSVAECFRNLVAVGASPVAIVDELNAGNPEKPEQFWYFEMMLKGLAWMAGELGLPVVGGKVSFYNEDHLGRQVKPTTTIVGVGVLEDVSRVTTADFKEVGSAVVVVGTTFPELGGSEYLYRVHGLELGEIPRPRPASELRNSSLVLGLARRGLALAVHDVALGGLGAALAEMSVLGGVGVEVDLERVPCRGCLRVDEVVFSETQARYVIEIRAEGVEEVLRLARQVGVEVSVIGRTVASGVYRLRFGSTVTELPLDALRDAYLGGLERYFR
ncbi:MAG: phosphoribosylformylglycinamidine synthase subunit PurL, partial [Desulfurococcaceae archaeon]|nr:phosphoribosylformylglycinamidine synthase subunit PurL [Desulfurococcaceae archaeon]